MVGMNTAPVEPPSVEHGFFRWIRGLGVQRSQERWIGGVAGGLGQRFGIDPLLARGLVVVLAVFSGAGLLLYGIAWALLPEPDGRIHLQEAGRGRWTAGMSGALVFFLLGLINRPTPFGHWNDGWWYGTLWTLLVVGGVVWFIVSRQKRNAGPGSYPTAPYPADTYPAAREGTVPPNASGFSNDAGSVNDTMPLNDAALRGENALRSENGLRSENVLRNDTVPLGQPLPAGAPRPAGAFTAPQGAPWPPNQPPVKQPRPEPPLPGYSVAIVVGVAVLVAGTIALLHVLGVVPLDGIVVPVAMAAALVVMGLGLVAAALRHSTGGALTGLTIALLVCTVLASGATLNKPQWGWGVPIIERSGNSYTNVFASNTVDLTGYSTITSDTTVRMDGAFSSLQVLVPDNIPVVITGDGAFYSLEVTTENGQQTQSGIGSTSDVVLNQDAAGPTLTVEIDGAFNNISVETAKAQVTP